MAQTEASARLQVRGKLERTGAIVRDAGQVDVGDSGHAAAKAWLFSAVIWLTIVDLFGLIIATELVNPNVFGGISWLEFGRVRPTHVLGVIFAWLSMMYWGAIWYILPRLLGSRLRGEKVAVATAIGWNAMWIAGVATIWTGHTQGREYEELIWPIDLTLQVIWLVNLVLVVWNVAHRAIKSIYVTVWWFLASPTWLLIEQFIGNVMWRPGNVWGATSGPHASGALQGSLDDGILNWWANHNLFGLWLTPMLVALTYYFVPKITNAPLYSHTLSLVSFWGIAFFYTGVGHHHLLQTPTPDWLKAFATANSIMLLIPVFAFITNILMSMRGHWEKFFTNMPLRFVLTGFVFYDLVNFQGAAQALPSFNAMTHFTNFVVGHAHLALLGGFTFLGMGAIDYIVPQIYRRPLWSRRVEVWQYWLIFLGFAIFFLALTFAGFIQGQEWERGIPQANVLEQLAPWFMSRAIGGTLIISSGILFAINIFMTVFTDTSHRTAARTARALELSVATVPELEA